MKPCPEYYDVRTELESIPTATMEVSYMVILTSPVNYSSHQRHPGSQPQGPVRGMDWDCKQRRGHRVDNSLQS